MNKLEMIEKVPDWIKEQKYQEYAANTLKQYNTQILEFLNWVNHTNNITKKDTMEYKEYLYSIDPRPATSTINTRIVVMNKFFKWLGCKDLLLKYIKQQVQFSNDEILSIADYKRLLRWSKNMELEQLYLIMKILAMTGIRISELKYFTYENIDYYITIFNKGKERQIILRQDLVREIRKYCREHNIRSGYIFKGAKKGKMICESTIWRQMKKVAGKARVNKTKVHAHSFRHLFAQIYLSEYSDNITELADILGHSSLETTRLYTRTSNAQKRNKLERLHFK